MSDHDRIHRVYKSVNKPLTICGAERRLFFVALMVGAATFNLLGSLTGGLALFGVLFLLARWATQTDLQLLPIWLRSATFKVQYDPAKRTPTRLRRVERT